MVKKGVSRYLSITGSKESNEIVSYFPISLVWIEGFVRRILSGEEARSVRLGVAVQDHKGEDGFEFTASETILLEKDQGLNWRGTKPWGQIRSGVFSKDKVHEKPRAAWTCEEVCEYVIKPLCMDLRVPYNYILKKSNPTCVSKIEFVGGTFVSYARRMKFTFLVESIRNYFNNVSDPFVWLDIFCANQPKLTEPIVDEDEIKELNDRLLTEGLHTAIAKFENRIIIFDSWQQPMVMQRAWCVWEIYGVQKSGTFIDIATSKSVEDEYLTEGIYDVDTMLNSLSKLDIRHAMCHNADDLETIFGAITTNSSFAEVCTLLVQGVIIIQFEGE